MDDEEDDDEYDLTELLSFENEFANKYVFGKDFAFSRLSFKLCLRFLFSNSL